MIEKNSVFIRAMDYIYYRIARFFYKKDGSSAHRALILLSAFQSLVVIEIGLVIVFSVYKREEISQFANLGKFLGGAICLFIFLLNMKKYKGKYSHFREKWRKEEIKVKRQRGILLVAVLVIPWLFLIVFGIR